MSQPLGSFCLVLHGHLPYVLKHGTWPHGEDWLFEAAAETYLPLLAMIGECELYSIDIKMTMGLTPVLLEQLAHVDFKVGFVTYLDDRILKAEEDKKEFEDLDNGHMAYLADQWIQWYTKQLDYFEKISRDIPKAYAKFSESGSLEILSSAATHGYYPLLLEDASVRAQIRAGLGSSEKILGFKPKGVWIPECAYRGMGKWDAPVNWASQENRLGVEHMLADEGITHFFVENHLIEQSKSEYVKNGDDWHKVGWDESEKYPARGWGSVNEPHLVNSDGSGPGKVAALARDNFICEQVWSGEIGYPADGVYLEFHKQWGARRGLRYWKITGKKADLGDKHLYYPENVAGKIHEHAQHFCNAVKDKLREHRDKTGRHGVVTACFDAELFGHWWFEGPAFIRDIMMQMGNDPEIELDTVQGFLEKYPADKTVTMPEGSWGEEGDHRVWTNEQVDWMWDISYRCESAFGRLCRELDHKNNSEVRDLLEKAGRELLLMQASDWAFVIRRGQAVDYGIRRFIQHVARFDCLIDICEKVAEDETYMERLSEVEAFEIKDAEIHDVIFDKIHLDWWRM